MKDEKNRRTLSDLQLLILLAAGRFLIHLLTNNQYGFHRDALAFFCVKVCRSRGSKSGLKFALLVSPTAHHPQCRRWRSLQEQRGWALLAPPRGYPQ
ncbi:hypothetical protein MNBD_CHLOROFLEXI01-2410 [hydrothermal vent metagenome]|uniref:Uncharacterized protein n=1 Tax=hydrothermal vent metagenome TaxID=652676 RepID=A0A3B0V2T5_9ZZZZ